MLWDLTNTIDKRLWLIKFKGRSIFFLFIYLFIFFGRLFSSEISVCFRDSKQNGDTRYDYSRRVIKSSVDMKLNRCMVTIRLGTTEYH